VVTSSVGLYNIYFTTSSPGNPESETFISTDAAAVPASERRGNNLEGFKDFDLQAKARIWSSLSYTCHIRLAAVWQVSMPPDDSNGGVLALAD